MNMTNFLVALVIVVVGAGAFLYFQPAEAPVLENAAMNDTGTEEDMSHEVMEEEESGATSTGLGSTAAPDVSIDISVENFAFSKKEIRVKEGDIVEINFTSESGTHSWVIDEFNAATDQVRTGESSSVTFVADKKGTFEYYCSVGEHRAEGLVGRLIVE